MSNRPKFQLTGVRGLAVALMRIVIGWHFAYEGLVKLLPGEFNTDWPGKLDVYLRSAEGPFAETFHAMANDPAMLDIVAQLNAWGLLLIGLALMFGVVTRLSALCGVVLLALYYAAHPTLFTDPAIPLEGTYLIFNKTLVELFAMLVIVLLPASRFGLDGLLGWYADKLWRQRKKQPNEQPDQHTETAARLSGRRQLLASMTGFPFVGGLAFAALEKRRLIGIEDKQLAGANLAIQEASVDGTTGATLKQLEYPGLDSLRGQVPTAKIGDVELSRIFMGGNLMNGYAHARDLIYVSKLIKSYHTHQKVFETFQLALGCGINTIMTSPGVAPLVAKFNTLGLGKVQYLAQCSCRGSEESLYEEIQAAIDSGACAGYIQGTATDAFVKSGNLEPIHRGMKMLQDAGIPGGIGAHSLDSVKACVDTGFEPDFWVKTLHHHNYWSSQTEDQKDNVWCVDPDETVEYMATLPQPWIGFKVLAAGALHPKDGFRYAFESGADFICVGMYDFQVVEDANICLDTLRAVEKSDKRTRPWRA